jgi:septum formation protein
MSDPSRHSRQIVLASASETRAMLLRAAGVSITAVAARVDEDSIRRSLSNEGAKPRDIADALAEAKARKVAQRFPDAVVIGSDTIVVIDGIILGKPRDRADAIAMVTRLSGRTHTVFTAVAVAHGGVTLSGVESVSVTFRTLDAAQIAAYVDTGEPMDKAGAYGIQGYGATNVERIDGDYFAVMGLPLGRMVGLLRDLGFSYAFGPITVAESGLR